MIGGSTRRLKLRKVYVQTFVDIRGRPHLNQPLMALREATFAEWQAEYLSLTGLHLDPSILESFPYVYEISTD